MPRGAVLYQLVVGTPGDTTAPTLNITVNPDLTKISRVAGKDLTTFSFQANEDYQGYQVRAVPNAGSPVGAGTQIKTGSGGSANVDRQVTISDDEIVNAGLGEAAHIIKIFGQDLAGNWSS